MTAALAFFLLAAAQTGPAAAPAPPPPPSGAALASAFSRYCLATGGDRSKFDAEVERAKIRKTSSPSLFSGVEFNRRWDVEGVELAYLDAPPPSGRACSVSAAVRGGYDGASIASAVAAAAKTTLHQTGQSDGMRVWESIDAQGNVLIVNNRVGPYFAGTEIILRPARQPAEEAAR
ncbi:MAG TPA: hypothetical protein VF718_14125 [Allosphingosinicella sp.]